MVVVMWFSQSLSSIRIMCTYCISSRRAAAAVCVVGGYGAKNDKGLKGSGLYGTIHMLTGGTDWVEYIAGSRDL